MHRTEVLHVASTADVQAQGLICGRMAADTGEALPGFFFGNVDTAGRLEADFLDEVAWGFACWGGLVPWLAHLTGILVGHTAIHELGVHAAAGCQGEPEERDCPWRRVDGGRRMEPSSCAVHPDAICPCATCPCSQEVQPGSSARAPIAAGLVKALPEASDFSNEQACRERGDDRMSRAGPDVHACHSGGTLHAL